MKNLIFALGAPGVGKTATCTELAKLLPNNIFLDADSLLNSTPFIYDTEMKKLFRDNLVHVLRNYLAHPALENIIHCWTIPKEEVLQSILANLDLSSINLHIFALTCSPQAHQVRISLDPNPRRKDTSLGSSTENLKLYKTLPIHEIDASALTPQQSAKIISSHVNANGKPNPLT